MSRQRFSSTRKICKQLNWQIGGGQLIKKCDVYNNLAPFTLILQKIQCNQLSLEVPMLYEWSLHGCNVTSLNKSSCYVKDSEVFLKTLVKKQYHKKQGAQEKGQKEL